MFQCLFNTAVFFCIPIFIVSWASPRKRPSIPYTSSGRLREPLLQLRPFLSGAYHLARKSGNFGLKSNGKVMFRKFRSEIVEYLQRYCSFSVRNGTEEISLPFAKLSSFQPLISRKQLREIEVQKVRAISFGWFADFGKRRKKKTLTIIQRSYQPVYSDKW